MAEVTNETERVEFDCALQTSLAAMVLAVDTARRGRMFAHYRLVVEANRQFNLTRITSPADAAVKHYADSLSLLATPWVDANRPTTVLDVGTGAGYPAVPLAIACPAWSVLAIDGTGKKARFVAESAAALGLANLSARHARAADLAREAGLRFDVVLVRAVGKIDAVLGETVPLLAPGGSVVFYKTVHLDAAESEAAATTAARLRLMAETRRVDLPLGVEILARALIRYSK